MAKGYSYENTETLAKFSQITVDAAASVRIKSGEHFTVTVKKNRGPKINISVQKQHLEIKRLDNNGHHLNLFHLSDEVEQFPVVIVVTVPKNQQLQQIVQTDQNQTLALDDVTINDELKLHGELNLNRVTANALHIETTDEDFIITNSQFTNGVSTMVTKDGDVQIRDVIFDQLEQFTLRDGDVSMVDVDVQKERVVIKSDDGDFDITSSHFEALDLYTTNGDVDFNALQIETNFVLRTNDGDVIGKMDPHDKVRIVINTEAGEVNVNERFNDDNAAKEYKFFTNAGDVTIS